MFAALRSSLRRVRPRLTSKRILGARYSNWSPENSPIQSHSWEQPETLQDMMGPVVEDMLEESESESEDEGREEEDREGALGKWRYGAHETLVTAPAHRLHCHSTRTNTINTFTDANGAIIAWFSGGSCGFKKRNRSTYEAGYQCAIRMFEKIKTHAAKEKDFRVDLFVKGFGQGREALLKSLATAQGDDVRRYITSITDRTPIKIGGTRSRKMKRR
ncbi:putative 37S ribosomal protein S18, mitochondrial [Mycena indigotica]|uniref:Putative 37S ribosomal protein S18, mitochondrial n=1 Tax=Mycena indigotica TaxID=2126181 RepID=A0A8H6SM06_9AGAR|nr:putative 37S ribosomal protein S18, mitochondrial [Mycena indigotica]KAF7301478.1 putative 37S ribosomal protein S18, mitochondrial [Mycena indigotica]